MKIPIRPYITAGLFLIVNIYACQTSQPTIGPPVSQNIFSGETYTSKIQAIANQINSDERVSVSWIYEEKTGNITLLGNRWRDATERAMRENGVQVVSRQEIGFLIDDIDAFGIGLSEKDIWQQAGADVIVSGKYTITHVYRADKKIPYISLTIKALRVKDSSLIQTITWSEPATSDWVALHTSVRGNVFYKKLEKVVDSRDSGNKPKLDASLNLDPPCYKPGEAAKITIRTEPGVHIYLFNLVADQTVTLLYPNSILPDQPLTASDFVFPPAALSERLQLFLYPLGNQPLTNESIKVVASRHKLDFSFLPIPVNQIYAGASGGDINRMRAVLDEAWDWQQEVLTYWVGSECQ